MEGAATHDAGRAALVFALAILTGLTLRAVFRLALRQTEGLIGSFIHLLGLALAVPDHSTLSRRAKTLEVPRPRPRKNGEPLHLWMDSTGLKLCGAGEWRSRSTAPRRAGPGPGIVNLYGCSRADTRGLGWAR